ASNTFFGLDLSASKLTWISLPPLPVALSHAVATAQFNGKSTCIYVIGGRTKTVSGISDLHNTVYYYDPSAGEWKEGEKIQNGKNITNISAATGVQFGKHQILLIGGDNGKIFHEIESLNAAIASAGPQSKKALEEQKNRLLENHPGFSKDILVYNTFKNSWKKLNGLPGLAPVTTTAVMWNGAIIVPSGEVKPGKRSPAIWRGEVLQGNKKPGAL
ncbi:MAG: sodium transporter, partial [Chitinophagaceae bacterium]